MSGPMPEDVDQGRRCRSGQPIQLCLQVLDLLAELTISTGKRSKSVLGRRRGIVQTAGTEAGTPCGESGGGAGHRAFRGARPGQ